jgi:steroid delta-isomerase-like uncharacterized protein
MNTDVKALVVDWVDTLNRHDADAAAEFFTEDCVFTNVGTGERLSGRAAVRDDHARLFGWWSEVTFELPSILVSGDRFAAEWVLSGVHAGDMPNLPATGRPFRIVGVGVGQVRDGKLAEITEYWNLFQFLTEVGASSVTQPAS